MIEPCACAADSKKFEPGSELSTLPDEQIAYLSPGRAHFREAESEFFRRSAFHESNHIIAGEASCWYADYATIGGNIAHVTYGAAHGEKTLLALMIRSISGMVAEGIAGGSISCPSEKDMREALVRARASMTGGCDRCFQARALIAIFSEAPDDILTATWRGLFRVALELFEGPGWRGALLTLGRELRERVTLYRDDIEAILAPFELMAEQEALLASLDLHKLLPAWGITDGT